MTGSHRRAKRTTTTDDYAAMLRRMITRYGERIGEDPAPGLGHLRELETAMTDATNFGIFMANKAGGVSINQLADMLGISKQAIYKRVTLGKQVAARMRAKRQRVISPARRALGTHQPSLAGEAPANTSRLSLPTSDPADG